ncbi:MAG: hypothetical protein U0271_22875 [Polyangiaceae bacterium]
MYIVRWQFQVRFGHLKDVIGLLRKWEVDVGQRVGWRASSLRVLQGLLGPSQSSIELETRADSLGDIESTFADMAKNPNHGETMLALEKYIVSGTDTWSVYQTRELFEGD